MVELGLIYLAQGRDELAKLVLGKAIAINDKDPAIYNALALVAMGAGDDQLAFFYFDKAAELDPNYIDTRFNKANVLLDAGDYQGAKLELEAIKAIVPGDQDVLVALGIAQRGTGDLDAARKTWSAVAKDSGARKRVRSDALFNLAILEMNFVMDDDKAKAALDRYLQGSSSKHSKRKEAVELRKELGE
jgi:Tfp pilus assembly protein PilF